MSRRLISELTDGETVEEIYLVADKQIRANRNGNLYLQVELRDRSGSISARLWNANENQIKLMETGDFVQVRGKVQLFQGALQMILNQIEKINSKEIPYEDFLPHTNWEINKLLERLRSFLLKVSNVHLRALGQCYLMDEAFMDGFVKAPAGIRVHHAYIGGLLEHVVQMLEIADRILALYPQIDRDLVILGIFIHDSGKVRELTYSKGFSYTDEGQLLGHITIGLELLEKLLVKVPELTEEPFPLELQLRLKHLLLSHHGTPEFGSSKVPMTPEAVMVHAIDSLDTRVHITLTEINEDRMSQSNWTQYNQAMERRIFKGFKTIGDSPENQEY